MGMTNNKYKKLKRDIYGDKIPNVYPEETEKFDMVSKPSHYTEGREFEPKDVIVDWDLNFFLGNALKYISRAGRKYDAIEDLRKAKQYIDFEIDRLTKEGDKKNE